MLEKMSKNLTVSLNNHGEKYDKAYSLQTGNSSYLSSLTEAIKTAQNQTNEYLTECVNKSKGQATKKQRNAGDSDDAESAQENVNEAEPETKKVKSL